MMDEAKDDAQLRQEEESRGAPGHLAFLSEIVSFLSYCSQCADSWFFILIIRPVTMKPLRGSEGE